jgi:nitroreductase
VTSSSDVLAAIRERRSVRSYSSQAVEPGSLERLLQLGRTAPHLTPVPPGIALVSGVDATRYVLTHIVGSYGLVRNAPHLLVAAMPEETPRAQVDTGYVLQQVVLDATILGLGSCWVTGTYDAEHAGRAAGLEAGEVAGAVCSLGYPARGGFDRLHDTAVRRLARGHRRKDLEEIVFSRRWGRKWSAAESDPRLVEVLECARLAPSAANRQPWRFIVAAERLSLVLTSPSYFDAGIAMAHVTLSSRAVGCPGEWTLCLGDQAWAGEMGMPRDALAVAVYSW